MTDARSSRHRSRGRFRPPPRVERFVRGRAPLVSLVPAVVAVLVVQSSAPALQRMPSGTSRFDLAAAWLLSAPGGIAGYDAWLASPPLGRLQYGLLLRLLQGGEAQTVLAAAHGAALLLAVVQTVLVWLLIRRLGGGAVGAGLAALLFGVAPVAVDAHAQVAGAGIGAVWALAAGVLVTARHRGARAAAGAAAALAIVSAPITAVPLIALAVGLLGRSRAADRVPWRAALLGLVAAGAVVGVGAAVVAALPAGPGESGLAALRAAEGAAPAAGAAALLRWLAVDPLSAVVAVAGLVVLAAGRRALPVVAAAVLLVAAAVWPLGADAVAPVVVLLPVVAVSTALVADRAIAALEHPRFSRNVVGSSWLTGLGALTVVAAVAWLAGLAAPESAAQPVAQVQRWLRTSVPADQVVLVDLAAWPDLAATGRARVGWYAAMPHAATTPSSRPWRTADYVVADTALGGGSGAAAAVIARAERVATFGTGGTRLSVLVVPRPAAAEPSTAAPTAAFLRAERYRAEIGAQLAENPRITLSAADRAALQAGDVDARIALALAQFVTRHRVTVAGFGIAAGDRSGVRSTVLVSAVDGRRIPGDGMRTGVLLKFLSELRGDFATTSIDATDEGVTATFTSAPEAVPGG